MYQECDNRDYKSNECHEGIPSHHFQSTSKPSAGKVGDEDAAFTAGQEAEEDPGGAHGHFDFLFEDEEDGAIEQVHEGGLAHVLSVGLLLDDGLHALAAVPGDDRHQHREPGDRQGQLPQLQPAAQLHAEHAQFPHQPQAPQLRRAGLLHRLQPRRLLLARQERADRPALQHALEQARDAERDALALRALRDHLRERGAVRREDADQQQTGRHRHAQPRQHQQDQRRGRLHLRLRRRVLVEALLRQPFLGDVAVVEVETEAGRGRRGHAQEGRDLLPRRLLRARDEGADGLDRVVGDHGLSRHQERGLHRELLQAVCEHQQDRHCHLEKEQLLVDLVEVDQHVFELVTLCLAFLHTDFDFDFSFRRNRIFMSLYFCCHYFKKF